MDEYCIRPVRAGVWEVAKFTWHKWPEVVYETKFSSCSCPAVGMCKHIKMVQKYVHLGQPLLNCFWIGGRGEINVCFLDVRKVLGEKLQKQSARSARG